MFIDTHIDTLWAMNKQKREFHTSSEVGHVDLHRAQQADLLCGFFTGYPTDGHYRTEKMLANWVRMVNDPRNRFRKIETMADLNALIDSRKEVEENEHRNIGIVLHFEGASGIDTDLNRLYIYHELGLRSMGLTWNEENFFATGQEQGEHRGLTGAGKDLLSAMEDLGIIIDVSHLNDKSFWDVLSHTNSPTMASHSNIREIADHRRNLTVEMAQALVDTGGSIGVNLYKAFLNSEPEKASAADAVRMFEKIIEIGGTASVHSGADLDGATLPDDMTDITSLPPLFDRVKEELSLDEGDMEKIKWGNVTRIMKHYWK